MQTKTRFANGKELTTIRPAEEGLIYYDNANRRVLTLYISPDYSMDEVEGILQDGLQEVTNATQLETGEEQATKFSGYTVLVEIAKKQVGMEMTAEQGQLPVVAIVVQLAKKTLQEVQNEEILDKQKKLEAALKAMGITL